MNNKQDKGFTLVELLIVIVILGILATVTVFAVRGITTKGQESACNADQKTLQTAVEAHYAQKGNGLLTVVSGTAEGQLVTEGLLVSPSGNYEVAADGSLTFQGAKCGTAGGAVPVGQAVPVTP